MGLGDQLAALLEGAPQDGFAVALGEDWWTWGQLRAVSITVDQMCTSVGLGPGARVGLLLQNRPEFVALALGVLASGRCITTLNPLQPPTRLATDISKATPPVVIGASDVLEDPLVLAAVTDHGVPVVVGPGGELSFTGGTRVWSDADLAPGTAIEMLTSGTTGPPKRIRLAYQQLDSAFAGQGRIGLPTFSQSVAIVSAPLVHIGGLWHALNNVLAGRRLLLLERFRVGDWVAAVERYRPKVASLVPSALQAVLDADVSVERLSSVTAITSGTAPCPPELAEAVYARYGIAVLTTYGATEFAGAVAGWTLTDHREWIGRKVGSVGRAFPGVTIRAVDVGDGTELTEGEPGLLQIRARQLGHGDEWVGTSDLGRVDEDGFVFITGRADDAIIRGGFKVQPTTVQKALEGHPSVRSAAVAALADKRLGQVPVAAVELLPGAPPVTPDELVALCRRQLVPYEVPVQIRIVDTLPRTPSMKISRGEVAAMFAEPVTLVPSKD